MPNAIREKYMNEPIIGSSKYMAKTFEDLKTISPNPGDKGMIKDGTVYFCWDKGKWEEAKITF